MNEPWALIVVACITSFATLGLGIATLLQGRKTHDTFNSRMDEFIKLIRSAGIAEGKELERVSNEKTAQVAAVARLEAAADLKSESKPATLPAPTPSQPS